MCIELARYSMHRMFASSPDSLSQIATARYCYILSKCTKKIRRGKTITLFFNETYSLPHRKNIFQHKSVVPRSVTTRRALRKGLSADNRLCHYRAKIVIKIENITA